MASNWIPSRPYIALANKSRHDALLLLFCCCWLADLTHEQTPIHWLYAPFTPYTVSPILRETNANIVSLTHTQLKHRKKIESGRYTDEVNNSKQQNKKQQKGIGWSLPKWASPSSPIRESLFVCQLLVNTFLCL